MPIHFDCQSAGTSPISQKAVSLQAEGDVTLAGGRTEDDWSEERTARVAAKSKAAARDLFVSSVEGAGLAAIGGDLIILLAWAVGGWIITIKTFRWE